GKLVDRTKFMRFLLDDLNYGANLRTAYANDLLSNYNFLADKEHMLVQLYNDRAQGLNPYFSRDIQQTASDSRERLLREINQLRDLSRQYLTRMSVEGIAYQTTSR